MYIIERRMQVEKSYSDAIIEKQLKPSVITKFKGFVKSEVLVNKKNEAYDEIVVLVYFASKKDFYRWEGSPEHIAMHKNKNHEHNKKPEGIIGVTRTSYELVLTKPYDGE